MSGSPENLRSESALNVNQPISINRARPLSREEIDKIRAVLAYSPDTGKLTWKIKFCDRITVGAEAGCVWTDKWGKQYRIIRVFGRLYRAHRLAWVLYYGENPTGQIDHENGDGLDNPIKNLRDVTHRGNSLNQKLRCTNTSGCFGVTWIASTQKWRATIYVKGKNNHLGVFTSKTSAVKARKAAEKRFGFHANHGRRVSCTLQPQK